MAQGGEGLETELISRAYVTKPPQKSHNFGLRDLRAGGHITCWQRVHPAPRGRGACTQPPGPALCLLHLTAPHTPYISFIIL